MVQLEIIINTEKDSVERIYTFNTRKWG